GDNAMVEAYFAGLQDLGRACLLTPEKIAEIVTAKDYRGIPALHMATLQGHTKVVKTCFAGLINLCSAGLAPAMIEEIVTAKDDRGIPALHRAFQTGDTAMVEAHLAGQQDLGRAGLLTPEKIAKIVTAALHMATLQGHTKVV